MSIKMLAEVLKLIVKSSSVSPLEFSTSKSLEFALGAGVTGAVTFQGICINDILIGKSQWFEFIGVGVGFGAGAKAGFSVSTEDFPSTGSRILEGPLSWNVKFDDLVGLSHIFTLSASVIGGQGLSIICFGESFGEPITAEGFLVTEGLTAGLAYGAGVTCYKGSWSKADG